MGQKETMEKGLGSGGNGRAGGGGKRWEGKEEVEEEMGRGIEIHKRWRQGRAGKEKAQEWQGREGQGEISEDQGE